MAKTIDDLSNVIIKFNGIWSSIRKKYPRADGTIYFSFEGNFVKVGASLSDILLSGIPLFLGTDKVMSALSFLRSKSITNKSVSDEDLRCLLEGVILNAECRIEIIWSELDYELIYELQNDSLIDLERTPHGRFSIRIVLGVIGD